ncbi:MAG: DUF2252 domain-containing protein [Methylacidiphilales bacterium]|nr:DUF2252 domain-containing protein [Candidatus Methylacidiphilales bacterium]
MDIVEATRLFEVWLKRRIKVVESDLDYKHEQMRADPFLFFRATYYRWAQLWIKHCPKLDRASEAFAVGDLHLENFGTWRDAEGRLVWGVNDFDEAHPMAFTNDLVRLAVSAMLAAESLPRFKLKPGEICSRIADGYRVGIERGGEPFVLMESHATLRKMALQDLRQPAAFWNRLEARSIPLKGEPPDSIRKAFAKILPDGARLEYRVLKTPKGLGSLGRRRYLAVVNWQGGRMAREAKSVAASASLWAKGKGQNAGEGNPWLERIVHSAVRCADPYYEVRRGWLVRRLGPDCSRIDLDELVHHEDLSSLLYCMGQETANIHLGTPKGRKRIRESLGHLPANWLETAAHLMLKLSRKDWERFRTKSV